MDPLKSIISVAASGMHAQGERLRVVSENVANANSTGTAEGEEPYRRKIVTFEEMVDSDSGASMVEVADITRDEGAFSLKYDPAHPAANEEGFVQVSNVSPIIEMANMREAARSYEANMNMFETGRRMRNLLLDMLK